MVDKLRGLAISLLVIGGFWLALLTVGWLSGVLPSRAPADPAAGEPDAAPPAERSPTSSAPPDAGRDANAPATEAPSAGSTPAQGRAPLLETAEEGAPAPPPPRRWLACAEDHVRAPILAVGQALGDERLEIAFACGERQQLLSTVSEELLPVRVASWRIDPGPRTDADELLIRSSPPAIGDVDGDGRPDVALAWWFQSPRGGSRNGGVFLARAARDGTHREPRRIATATARRVVLADLDRRGGLDAVVVDRGRPWAEHSPEGSVLLLSGAARPRERASFDVGMRARDVITATLDAGQSVDLVVLGNPVHVLVGDDRPWRHHVHRLGEAASAAVAGDFDGDGLDEVVLDTRPPRLVEVAGGEIETRTLGAGPITPVQAVDVDGDERAELLAIADGRLLLYTLDEEGRFRARRLGPEGARVHDARLADVDADGQMDLVAATGDRDGFETLTLVADVLQQPGAAPTGPPEELEDAPVVSRHIAR